MYFFRISFPYQYQHTLPVKSGNLLSKKRGKPAKRRSKTYSYNKTDNIFICCLNPKLPWQPQKGCLDQSSPVTHPPHDFVIRSLHIKFVLLDKIYNTTMKTIAN